MHKTVVIGGGPAGSKAAELLAKDRDVLVFEEHAESGTPVGCAGLVTDKVLEMSGVRPDILNKLYGANVFFPGGRKVSVRSKWPKANVIDRADLDRKMAWKANDAGAEYRFNEKYFSHTISDRVKIESTNGTTDCSLIIGADGHSSRVARTLGIDNSPREYVRGFQMDVRKKYDEEDMINIRLGSKVAPGFFSWELPFGDFVRVGMCTSWSAGPPVNYMQPLLKAAGLESASVIKKYSGKIPLGGRPISYGERLMLIGDAAGQVKPISGGGLYPAFKSAEALKDVANIAFETNDFSANNMSQYEEKWKNDLGKELKNGYRLRRAYVKFTDDDLDRAGKVAARESVRSTLDEIDLDSPSSIVSQVKKGDIIRLIPVLLRALL
ncbi:MAG TPA: NAD(P)/FAD-dependent oxidoreductase [Candidatus Methanomethylophilaceae archaeon]|nr:NAD(P)/FAD-dependent oxidoreductase [Candidatus Methanomethylophilaceae archaeon]